MRNRFTLNESEKNKLEAYIMMNMKVEKWVNGNKTKW